MLQCVRKSWEKKLNIWVTCSWFQIFWHFAFEWCIFRLFIDLRNFVANIYVEIYALFPQMFCDWKADSANFSVFRMYAIIWYYDNVIIIIWQELQIRISYLITFIESPLFRKYSMCRVFSALWWYEDHHMIIIWWSGRWHVARIISSQKIYGLYGLKHHIVERRGDVTDEQLNEKRGKGYEGLLSQWMLGGWVLQWNIVHPVCDNLSQNAYLDIQMVNLFSIHKTRNRMSVAIESDKGMKVKVLK